MRGFGRLLLFGFYGAGGAVAGVLCGLVIADLAAQAFGDPFQFYHFAVVLACIGAGIAIGTTIAHAFSDEHVTLTLGLTLAAATWGAASAVAGCVIAHELVPVSHAADFAAVAWGGMGAFLGWTVTMLLDRYHLIPTACGGMTAGAAVGWMLFDPTALVVDIVMEAAVLGFLIPAMIGLTDIFCRSLVFGSRRSARHSTRWRGA